MTPKQEYRQKTLAGILDTPIQGFCNGNIIKSQATSSYVKGINVETHS